MRRAISSDRYGVRDVHVGQRQLRRQHHPDRPSTNDDHFMFALAHVRCLFRCFGCAAGDYAARIRAS